MIRLNMKARSISDLEKALVIRSLHFDDGLTQAEIAKILDRHPSWVCRKLSLVERLSGEVTANLKLGLINMTMGLSERYPDITGVRMYEHLVDKGL